MARKLKPCGTYAAYIRHLKHNEKPCDPCTLANRERSYSAPSGFNAYERQMDAALEANPPKIVWRKGKDGILRAESVNDPHTETPQQRRRDREFAADMDAYFAPQPATEPECTDENLLAAGQMEI